MLDKIKTIRVGKRLLAFLLLPFIVLGLSGCLKLEMDYKVSSDGSVVNSYAMLYEKEFMNQAGISSLDQFKAGMEDAEKEEAAAATPSPDPFLFGADETWASQGIVYSETDKHFVMKETFVGTPGLANESFGVGVQDGKMKFYLDLTTASEDLSNDDQTAAALAQGFMPEAVITVSMPGEILSYSEKNATQVDAQTIKWEGKITDLGKLEAVSEPDQGSGLGLLIPISLTVLFLGLIVGTVLYLRNQKKDIEESYEEEEAVVYEDDEDIDEKP